MKDVSSDYYVRLREFEEQHWWHVGMREIATALLRDRLARGHLTLLDAGCGTGGFLAWASRTGSFDGLCGVDISAEAVDLARAAVPSAELHVAPVRALPFPDASFDVVSLNDVLQHVDEAELARGLAELRRVLHPDGCLLVRTNGGRKARTARSDWRLYDSASLRAELVRGSFEVHRVTHANMVLSLWAAARGRGPAPPMSTSCAIPGRAGRTAGTVGRSLLRLEARFLRTPRRALPYGHTLFAVAIPGGGR